MTTTRANTSTPPKSVADVVLVGRLGARIAERELPSGDRIVVFTVVVDRPRGAGAPGSSVKVDSIACQTFRTSVVRKLESFEPGDWVRVEGRLSRRFWRAGAALGSAMEVDVSRVQRAA